MRPMGPVVRHLGDCHGGKEGLEEYGELNINAPKKKLSASGRLPSGRPFLRRRGSSRDVERDYAPAD